MGTLKTNGKRILDPHGRQVMLRGYNLSTWLMLENFMLGTPGVEQKLRKYLYEYGGKEKAEFFFEKFLEIFIQEEDIAFLKEIGCDHVRVPFNYRLFENDGNPMKFKKEGFRHIDRLIALCRKYGLYVVLDLHAAQGYQNRDWHSDNDTGWTGLFDNEFHQKRLAALWEFIADHYKEEEVIAGYEIMNEPVCVNDMEVAQLNRIHKAACKAIRETGSRQLVFIEGNLWGRSFKDFEDPWDDNLVASIHYYSNLALFNHPYPAWTAQEVYYDKAFHRQQMDIRDEYARKFDLPVWVSEFGMIYNTRYNEDKKRLLADQLDIFRERGYGWAQWGYKDIGNMGLVICDPDGPWMRFVSEFIRKKVRFRSDFDPMSTGTWDLMDLLRPHIKEGFGNRAAEVEDEVKRNLSALLADELCKDLCNSLARMPSSDLEDLLSSFSFERCLIREDWKELISEKLT